jgi:hypothetical protein
MAPLQEPHAQPDVASDALPGSPAHQVPSEPRAGTVGPTVTRVIDVDGPPPDIDHAAPGKAAAGGFPGGKVAPGGYPRGGPRGARMPGAPIPEAERPRWHAPSSPQQPELFLPSLPPPRAGKRRIQVLIAIAVGLTVTFVAVAIVATELAR